MMLKKLNLTFLKLVIFIALLPVMITLLLGLSPILIVLIIFGVGWKCLPGFSPITWLATLIATILSPFTAILKFLFGMTFSDNKSARFMGFWERGQFLNSRNTGFLIDGQSKRLSEKTSFESAVTLGGMGRGKTTRFIIPNLLTTDGPSVVISDTSGEIYNQTSGYLASKGYNIRVLNLMDMLESDGYNPLASLKSHTDIDKAADIIVRSSKASGGNDPIWAQGAQKLIRIFIQCLINRGDPSFQNLANVKHLISNFDTHSVASGQLSKIDQFVLASTANDPSTFSDYRGFTAGNAKTLLSFLSTADAALAPLANPELAGLTSQSTINFDELRNQKTALYVMVRQQDMVYYQFLLNLFYSDLFSHLLGSLNNIDRPVYLHLDEFGQLQIPEFAVYATTARKYNVGFWLFLQSLSQLETQYGPKGAETILDGLQTEIYLPGLSHSTARQVADRLGRIQAANGKSNQQLLSADQIIRMKDGKALLLNSNRYPLEVNTKPFFKTGRLVRRSKKAAFQPPASNSSVNYVVL